MAATQVYLELVGQLHEGGNRQKLLALLQSMLLVVPSRLDARKDDPAVAQLMEAVAVSQ